MKALAADQPLRVEAHVDKAVAAIGDKITLTLQAIARKGVDVSLPADIERQGGLDMRDVKAYEPKALGGGDTLSKRQWVLSPEKTGSYIFAPMEVSYVQAGQAKGIKTTPVYLDVRSVLKPGDLRGDIKDIKNPVHLPSPVWIFLTILGALVVLVPAGYAVWRWWKNRPKTAPPLLPHEWALQRLDHLLRSGLLAEGKFKEFTEELSGIFRVYVEKRFGLSAPERTTEEFVLEIKGRQEFSGEQRLLLRDFLTFCDMIKFAKYAPSEAEMNKGIAIVRGFVEQTTPLPEDPKAQKPKEAAVAS